MQAFALLLLPLASAVHIVPFPTQAYKEASTSFAPHAAPLAKLLATDMPVKITGAPSWGCEAHSPSFAHSGAKADTSATQRWIYRAAASCPEATISVYKPSSSAFWGKMVMAKSMPLMEFVDRFYGADGHGLSGPSFGFDFSFPISCPSPQAYEGFELRSMSFLSPAPADERLSGTPVYPGLYMATDTMSTAAHVDNDYSAFWARLCQGTKKWRVIPQQELVKHWAAVRHLFHSGTLLNDIVVNGHVAPNFPDLHDDAKLNAVLPADMKVYEATARVGDVLAFPQSTVHGAVSLDDSIMIVRNIVDLSPESAPHQLKLWRPTCAMSPARLQGTAGMCPTGCQAMCGQLTRAMELSQKDPVAAVALVKGILDETAGPDEKRPEEDEARVVTMSNPHLSFVQEHLRGAQQA